MSAEKRDIERIAELADRNYSRYEYFAGLNFYDPRSTIAEMTNRRSINGAFTRSADDSVVDDFTNNR